jgi:uncharacterized YigZ family protein
MEDTYNTLEKPAEGMFKDRNSRFLAFGYPVENVDQINVLVSTLRKKYHDARHHCYAYRLGIENESYRQNDDGEPSGTAGKPIYNQILSHNLTNILIVVVRYFGGTLLGTGGLINAYKSATADLINNAIIVARFIEERHDVNFPYEKLSIVMKVLKDESLVPLNPVYDVQCALNLSVRRNFSGRIVQKLSAIPGVKIKLSE